jgi:hypothetical protein
MSARRRSLILTLLLTPLLAAPLTAKPVELKDLTQDLLRGRVKEYLAHPDSAQRRAALGGVTLRDDLLFYSAVNGIPQRLEWRFQVPPGYDPAREMQTRAAIRDLLYDVLVRFEGGLLNERDAQMVLSRAVFVPAGAPGMFPRPPLGMPPGQPMGAAGAGYNPWRFVIYPWVATAPHCHYWWQYPWYAAPWWAPPWTSYWQTAGYYPTPGGYWYLPPEYYRPAPWLYPPPIRRPSILVENRRPVGPIAANRTAESLYLEGFDRYFDGDAGGARRLLAAAAERDPNDARIWYFKALAEQELGNDMAARESARRGAALEMIHGASRAQVARSLERVQGDSRWFLRDAGRDMTLAQAREIAAGTARVATVK